MYKRQIYIPIPTLTAFFMFAGMALKIASRTLIADKIIKIIPSVSYTHLDVYKRQPQMGTPA